MGGEHFIESVRGGENDFRKRGGIGLESFRRENVFEQVRERAELAETAGRGIAFQSVDGAADFANGFGIAGALFELEAAFIHGLEKLGCALEEELAQLGAAIIAEKIHCASSMR